ncbi:MAG: glycosyltransferase family 9 protein [SAR324 cluster bacterium]|uniref:Glycosyltransferase family 9 protein n=1 Tax=SAR324 cluster bacterium TaxID=2024889 RepID=A0A7X9FTB1_9DELT|nr:glycosyltransferase family 9 protein [SAR324 cluster bacterium]
MKVRLTQIIDYWLGVPMAAIFSLIHWLRRRTFKPELSKPKKILFIEISEMGSAIIAYSSLLRAKELIESNELYFLVFEKNRESVELLKVIPKEHIITIPDTSFLSFALGAFKALAKVRALQIDTVIDMELFSRFTALFSFASGASRRVGFHNYTAEGLYRGTFLTHRVFYNPHQHMSQNFLALVFALSAEKYEEPLLKRNVSEALLPLPSYEVDNGDKQAIEEMLEERGWSKKGDTKLVVFNPDPGEALPIRGWPLSSFVEVAKALVEHDPKVLVVVIGLKRSKTYAEALSKALPLGCCIDLTGKTKSLSQVVTLFTMSKLLIGNDSGPAHFAALTKIPILTLYGPETPALYGPLSDKAENLYSGYACSPCLSAANHRHSICRDSKCLKAISPEIVIETALRMLN